MKASEVDSVLQCSFFEKLYTNMCLLRGGTRRKMALDFEICHRTAERKSIFVGWYNLNVCGFAKRSASALCDRTRLLTKH